MKKIRNITFIMILICSAVFGSLYFYYFPKSKIPISNNIEISLGAGKKYRDYVLLLNRSFEGNSKAIKEILKVDYLYNAAGYDHGYILLQLMEKLGDDRFSKELKSLNKKETENVQNYVNVGIDGINLKKIQLLKQRYPKSLGILQLR